MSTQRDVRIRLQRITVDHRSVPYIDVGEGRVVLFLHGWGLGPRSYERPIRQLVDLGCRVIAPTLPGLAGCRQLHVRDRSVAGYGQWVTRFLDTLGIDGPISIVGHSLGGGVAAAVADLLHERTQLVVLVNAVGGAVWQDGHQPRSLSERPFLHWFAALSGDVPVRRLPSIATAVRRDLRRNMLHPLRLWNVSEVARRADCTSELRAAHRRGIPIVAVSSERDRVVPRAAYEAVCREAVASRVVVPGPHAWLVDDEVELGRIIAREVSEQPSNITVPADEPASPTA